MSRELIYSVEVAIVRCPGDGDGLGGPTPNPTVVRYCDVCRRWGAAGSAGATGASGCGTS